MTSLHRYVDFWETDCWEQFVNTSFLQTDRATVWTACLICTRSMHLPVVTCIPFTLLEVGKRNVYANMPPRYLRNCVYLLTDSSSLMYKKRHVYKLCLVFLHSLYFYEFKFLKDCSSNQKLLNLILVKFLIVNWGFWKLFIYVYAIW